MLASQGSKPVEMSGGHKGGPWSRKVKLEVWIQSGDKACHIDRRIWFFPISSMPSWRRYFCLWQLRVPCCQAKRFDSTRSIDA